MEYGNYGMLKKLKKTAVAFAAAAGAAGVLGAAQSAEATTITWQGTLDATGGTLAGETIPFSVQLQSDAVDQDGTPTSGVYAADSFTLNLPTSAGGPVTFFNPDLSVEIPGIAVAISDNLLGLADAVDINANSGAADFVSLGVSTLNTSVLSTDALPAPLPPFSAFDNGKPFNLSVGGHTAWGDVSSLQTVVPEPGTGVLMGLGLAGLAAASRRRPAPPQS